jgi:hypothetical protein
MHLELPHHLPPMGINHICALEMNAPETVPFLDKNETPQVIDKETNLE